MVSDLFKGVGDILDSVLFNYHILTQPDLP